MDASGMLSKLLSDPAALEGAAQLLEGMLKNTPSPPDPPGGASPNPDPTPGSAPGHSPSGSQENGRAEGAPQTPDTDALAAMLGNPDFIRSLPEMLSAVGPLLSGLGASPSQQAPASPNLPDVASGHPSPLADREQDRRKALLLALKPYLSPERAEIVDQILRLTELFKLFSLFSKKGG